MNNEFDIAKCILLFIENFFSSVSWRKSYFVRAARRIVYENGQNFLLVWFMLGTRWRLENKTSRLSVFISIIFCEHDFGDIKLFAWSHPIHFRLFEKLHLIAKQCNVISNNLYKSAINKWMILYNFFFVFCYSSGFYRKSCCRVATAETHNNHIDYCSWAFYYYTFLIAITFRTDTNIHISFYLIFRMPFRV